MSAPSTPVPDQLHEELRKELLRMARHEDELAAREAERVRYWEPPPPTVAIHRQCAAALRDAADEMLAPGPSATRG